MPGRVVQYSALIQVVKVSEVLLTRSFSPLVRVGRVVRKARLYFCNSYKWKLGKFKENNMTDDKQILQTTIRFIHAQNTYSELQQQPH